MSPNPPPPLTFSRILRGMFRLNPTPPQRLYFSLRASLCMGVPILVGWLFGDSSAGLMAAIGGFTSLFGSGRPYRNRAIQLAWIVLAFASAVAIGMLIEPYIWAVVIGVSAIAMFAVWLSNAFRLGPPGAYMFALACAAGTAMPAGHISPPQAALLVVAGGSFAWLIHMLGALFSARAPEKNAVRAAVGNVIRYIEAIGTSHESAARHAAALALHRAWDVLVSLQPANSSSNVLLGRLRRLNRELHLRFAEAMGNASRKQPSRLELLDETRTIVGQIQHIDKLPSAGSDTVSIHHPGKFTEISNALRSDSNTRRVILRVGVAALIAGSLGAAIHLERAYWAVAASVLMLFQGMEWLRMLERSIQRLIGTWVGLLLAGAILTWYPQGLWLVLVVMILQFTIEMLVMRNYALAAIFITGAGLTIASGGQRIDPLDSYLLARGVDTLIGCLIALLVFRLIPPLPSAVRIRDRLISSITSVDRVIAYLARGEFTSAAAKIARRELQTASFALSQAYTDSISASRQQRREAEQTWPAIAATERLIYRTLSACWALEHLGEEAARESAQSMFANDGAQKTNAAIDVLITAIRENREPESFDPLPHVIEDELSHLRTCLLRETIVETSSES